MKAFNDTNVPIAYVFLFEPQCVMARHIICDEYDDVYWSENVVDEFQDRVGEKQENLLRFYEKLEIELYSYRKFEYSLSNLKSLQKISPMRIKSRKRMFWIQLNCFGITIFSIPINA